MKPSSGAASCDATTSSEAAGASASCGSPLVRGMPEAVQERDRDSGRCRRTRVRQLTSQFSASSSSGISTWPGGIDALGDGDDARYSGGGLRIARAKMSGRSW